MYELWNLDTSSQAASMKLKPQYSGNRSQRIWDTIGALKQHRGEMYTLFVALQNLESQAVRLLNNYTDNHRPRRRT